MAAVQSPVIPIVGELIRRHPGTISLGQGVVHYGPPPQALREVVACTANPENHKYKAVEGIPPLLDAIAAKLSAENGIAIDDTARVVVTAGGNMAFMNAILAIADPGDEVILLTPYYFNHEMAVAMANCRPVLVPTDASYQPQLDAIESAIGPRTRAVVTVSPNNPTGAVYPESMLRRINDLCRRRGVWHISDEAYEYFTYDGAAHFSPGSIDGAREHTISLYSLSKAYGFASWRVGYMVIPEKLLTAVKKIQDTILICPPVVCQHAAVGALSAGVAYCREHLAGIAEVRQVVAEALADVRDLCDVPRADGAFYFLLRVHSRRAPMELVEDLVRNDGVAVIPGDAFGMVGGCHLRVAYGALLKETAAEGIGRLTGGLRRLAAAGVIQRGA